MDGVYIKLSSAFTHQPIKGCFDKNKANKCYDFIKLLTRIENHNAMAYTSYELPIILFQWMKDNLAWQEYIILGTLSTH